MKAADANTASDSLTQTTLQFDEHLSVQATADTLYALKRVPGVLLAQISTSGARAIVAHDAGVSSAALLAAAGRYGGGVQFVSDTRIPAAPAVVERSLETPQIRRCITLVAGLCILLAIIEAIDPRLAANHALLPIFLLFVWAFIITRALLRRRQ